VKIEILPRAEQDILRQFRYYLVERDAPLVALEFREAVIKSLQPLKAYPRIGPLVRSAIHGLRCWPVKGFESIRIYYVETTDCLRVVRILHGKRNIRRILMAERIA
jgi:plasmid stabilization system protein ParE